MPPNSRVAIIDDNPDKRFLLSVLLGAGKQHVVVQEACAESYEQAIELLPNLGGLAINVVLLDARLEDGRPTNHGDMIAAFMRSQYGNSIHIVGISGTDSIGMADIPRLADLVRVDPVVTQLGTE